jgi:hypothetical protein
MGNFEGLPYLSGYTINAYTEIEKIRHNTAFTEKLRQSIQDIEEGRGIVKTLVELEDMENE